MFSLLLHKAAHLVFPPFCEWCRQLLPHNSDILCICCKQRIRPLVAEKVALTKNQNMWVYTMGAYQDPLRYLIISKRWSYRLASKYLGNLIWNHSSISMLDFDMVTAVPLHWTRQAWRGYNQAEIMARHIAHQAQREYTHTVTRTMRTSFQSLYVGSARIENVKHVFKLRSDLQDRLHGKHILLVDDLMTSGSTLKYVAKELLKAHPRKISAVVAARAA